MQNPASDEDWSPTTPPVAPGDVEAFPVLVLHYWAAWDLHDREMDQRLAAVRDEYAERVCFRSCDVDRLENRPIVRGIANVPALGCFIEGRWVESLIGVRRELELRSILDRWLAAARAAARSRARADPIHRAVPGVRRARA